LVTGPCRFVCGDFEEVVRGPTKMIFIPPEHYVLISSPVLLDHGQVVMENGQAKIRQGEKEIRFHQQPFPLFDQ